MDGLVGGYILYGFGFRGHFLELIMEFYFGVGWVI
jgi:hypothetical protein